MDLSNNKIEFVEEGTFDNFSNLYKLSLVNTNIPIEHLFSFGYHPKLEILEFGNLGSTESVSPNSTSTLSNSYPNLKSLRLYNVGTRKISSKIFYKAVPNLKELLINQNKITNNVQITGLHSLKSLCLSEGDFRSLILTDKPDTCQSEQQICVGPMNNLENLSTDNCNISALSVQFFSHDALPKLTYLTLYKSKLKVVSFMPMATASFPKLRSLEVLVLDCSDLDYPIQKIICSFPNLKVLAAQEMTGDLNLNINRHFNDRCLSNLTRFYLYNNSMREIPENLLINTRNLELLDLTNNNLTEFSLATEDLSLKTLRLYNNKIRCDDDCSDVIKLDNLKDLKCLDIGENEIGQIGLRYLKPLLNGTAEQCQPCYVKDELDIL